MSHLDSSGLVQSHQAGQTAGLLALEGRRRLSTLFHDDWLLTLAARCLSRALDMLDLVPSMAAITLGCTVGYGC